MRIRLKRAEHGKQHMEDVLEIGGRIGKRPENNEI